MVRALPGELPGRAPPDSALVCIFYGQALRMTLGLAPEMLGFPRALWELRLRERHMACTHRRGSQRRVSRLAERGPAFRMAPSPAKNEYCRISLARCLIST